MDPEALIFDCLTFTLTTGDEEWRPSAVETIEGIRRIKEQIPGVKTSLGVSNVSFGVGLPARSVLNSVFLHHCVEAGLDLAMVNPNHITPYGGDSRATSASSPTTWCSTAARTRSSGSSPTSSPRARPRPRPTRPTRPRAWSPRRRCTSTSCAARRRASRTGSTASVEKIGAVPTLNEVLLPAMKEVGDKFGAGELILPFVLQSAEVMKRAVAQLERYLDKIEGYTKGTVVVATVFGDVHDIGKSLVNTILTNNGYTVVDLGKQVPISDDPRRRRRAQGDRDRAVARCSSRPPSRCPPASRSSTRGAATFPVLIGGAAINRNFGLRILYPNGTESDEVYEPGVFYCKDAFEGLAKMDQLVDAEAARGAGRQDPRRGAASCASSPRPSPTTRRRSPTPRCAARRATDNPIPEPPFWGVREIEVPLDEVYHHLDTHVLFKLHWGGRGVKGEEWRQLRARGLPAAAGADVARAGPTCTRARCSATSRATPTATS